MCSKKPRFCRQAKLAGRMRPVREGFAAVLNPTLCVDCDVVGKTVLLDAKDGAPGGIFMSGY
jgi:hypothetical protein